MCIVKPLIAIVLLLGTCYLARGDETAQSLIKGVLARSKAIHSGRIEYTTQIGKWPAGKVRFSFSGKRWAYRGVDQTAVNTEDSLIVFDRNSADGRSSRPQAAEDCRAIGHSPPLFAGSFWHSLQRNYLETRIKDFAISGEKQVDGHSTTICDLSLKKDQLIGFGSLDNELINGGVLRLYVAPSLGYVLPLIENVTPDGRVILRWTASLFQQDAPGIFIPHRITREYVTKHSISGYELGECTMINQKVPDEDFAKYSP